MKTRLLRRLRKNIRIVPSKCVNGIQRYNVERWITSMEYEPFWRSACTNESFAYSMYFVHNIIKDELMNFRKYKNKYKVWP